jgi:hypothetical protein
MRAMRIALIALLAMGTVADLSAAQPARMALPQPVLAAFAVGVQTGGFDLFYNNLSPYGQWVNRPSYGYVWVPRRVGASWRPYTQGHWVYTDYGWTWMSSEPWGWATYHYGRWNRDPDYGWAWVPGTDWGPAWVSFQQGDGYVGWAPLPPTVGWDASVGLAFGGGFGVGVDIGPSWYSFCPERAFLSANVFGAIVPWDRNVTIIRNTTNITNFNTVNGQPFNRSLAVDQVQRMTGRPVPRLAVTNISSPRQMGVRGNQVALFRPAIAKRNLDPSPQVLRQSARFAASRPPTAARSAAMTAQRGAATRQLNSSQQAIAQRGARSQQYRQSRQSPQHLAGQRNTQRQAASSRNSQRPAVAQRNRHQAVAGGNQRQAASQRGNQRPQRPPAASHNYQRQPAAPRQSVAQHRTQPQMRQQARPQPRVQHQPPAAPPPRNQARSGAAPRQQPRAVAQPRPQPPQPRAQAQPRPQPRQGQPRQHNPNNPPPPAH